jgi:cellulose synthase/poly-beta-1,6-N-acetylglucosamine synthase-like glycosyltransferase
LIPAALLLPNIVFLVVRPVSSHPLVTAPAAKWLESVEWISRIAVFLIPCLYRVDSAQITTHRVLFAAILSTLTFYYYGWLRYFFRREIQLLYAPMLGIPYPMAVIPITYLLLASMFLHSAVLASCTVLFGAAHIAISHHTAQQIGKSELMKSTK